MKAILALNIFGCFNHFFFFQRYCKSEFIFINVQINCISTKMLNITMKLFCILCICINVNTLKCHIIIYVGNHFLCKIQFLNYQVSLKNTNKFSFLFFFFQHLDFTTYCRKKFPQEKITFRETNFLSLLIEVHLNYLL